MLHCIARGSEPPIDKLTQQKFDRSVGACEPYHINLCRGS